MCGQCVFLKEKYEKVGNGGGKKYYCEYLKDMFMDAVLVQILRVIRKETAIK